MAIDVFVHMLTPVLSKCAFDAVLAPQQLISARWRTLWDFWHIKTCFWDFVFKNYFSRNRYRRLECGFILIGIYLKTNRLPEFRIQSLEMTILDCKIEWPQCCYLHLRYKIHKHVPVSTSYLRPMQNSHGNYDKARYTPEKLVQYEWGTLHKNTTRVEPASNACHVYKP